MQITELNHQTVLSYLPDRRFNAHKGDFGKLLFLCGSRGYTGAAALASLGALRSGAGLVYLGVPESIYSIEAVKLLEPVVFPVADKDGLMSCAAVEQIGAYLDKVNAVLIGPGSGQSEDTYYVVKWLLENYTGPVVLDADGINVISGHKDILRGRKSPTILTPHQGEFDRFIQKQTKDRIGEAVATASDLEVIVVLKGHETIVTDGKLIFLNRTGNPGMAVGGSGDVLAGVITSLLGQGLKPIDAAACGVFVHGAAGDICAQEIGQYGMLPSDMLEKIPRLLK